MNIKTGVLKFENAFLYNENSAILNNSVFNGVVQFRGGYLLYLS